MAILDLPQSHTARSGRSWWSGTSEHLHADHLEGDRAVDGSWRCACAAAFFTPFFNPALGLAQEQYSLQRWGHLAQEMPKVRGTQT